MHRLALLTNMRFLHRSLLQRPLLREELAALHLKRLPLPLTLVLERRALLLMLLYLTQTSLALR